MDHEITKPVKPKVSRSRIKFPKVSDRESAIEYQKFLLNQTQKGKIERQVANVLSYQLQNFHILLKAQSEETEIRQIIEFGIEKIKNEILIRMEKSSEVLQSIIGPELFDQYCRAMNSVESEIKALIASTNKEIFENIKNRTSYRIAEKFAETPENLVEMIKSGMNVLPDEHYQQVIKHMQIKKLIP